MTQPRQDRLRLLSPDQEHDVDAVVHDLLTGDASRVPADLVDDIAAVRTQCRLGAEQIPGADGVPLDAFAAWPLTGGPHPLIILPAGLDPAGWKMYGGAIIRLLMRRYAVVAYTERGLPGSGGELTVAGPEDVADGRKVIDWALAKTELRADPDRIGMLGISYGSGISQLVANADERVGAVVALSTWADLGQALYDNRTRHIAAAEALAAISDRPSPGLVKVLEDFRNNTNIEEVLEWAEPRSPAHLTEMRPVPTFFTSYWHETIFPQNQLLDWFDRYPGPKRLDLAIGDHGAVEIPGLTLGVYTRTTEAAYDWLDHHLRDVDNGIDRDGIVHTETMYNFAMEAGADLKSWSNSMLRYYLNSPSGASTDGALTTVPARTCDQSIQAGTEEVRAASALVFDGFLERLLMPKRQLLDDVDRGAAAVWTTEPFPEPQRIAGVPEVQLTVTPSDKTVTVVAYLFDHNPFTGHLRIITHTPVTVRNAEPGRPTAVHVRMQAADYRIPAGHKLTMIIDTKDHLYGDETVAGTTVALSNQHGPAYVDVPMSA
ncbi:CocE/NonD family hydrolase [Nocardia amikacinitolerans]|uniref:CocE/NonD family hydrolase n=1 Tax=Nocardia amikacinitolerans TaxID=756689 RepID=UPI0020A4107D|nr:CocE/NonD family hydrolase [Nocardia amikacinitolerans]MCP2279654.1 putative acyl esterase [Nocardia amikacinitolerans]